MLCVFLYFIINTWCHISGFILFNLLVLYPVITIECNVYVIIIYYCFYRIFLECLNK